MTIAIIGENCSGKSTLANALAQHIDAQIMTGRDYLRMAKSETEAAALFKQKLESAVTGSSLIYVISEPALLALLPAGAVRILVKADLETIKERFRARMQGNLPAPVAQMLERRHGCFDDGCYDYVFQSGTDNIDAFCERLKADHSEVLK